MSKKYCIALDDYERGTIINCLGLKVMRMLLIRRMLAYADWTAHNGVRPDHAPGRTWQCFSRYIYSQEYTRYRSIRFLSPQNSISSSCFFVSPEGLILLGNNGYQLSRIFPIVSLLPHHKTNGHVFEMFISNAQNEPSPSEGEWKCYTKVVTEVANKIY